MSPTPTPTLPVLQVIDGVLPLARELGERLGGEPWCKPIPAPGRIETAPCRPHPGHYSPEAQAEMQRIYRGEEM